MIKSEPDASVLYSLVVEELKVEQSLPDLVTEAQRKDRLAGAARNSAVRAHTEHDEALRRLGKLQEAIIVLADAEKLDHKVIDVWRRNLRGEGTIEELRRKVGV